MKKDFVIVIKNMLTGEQVRIPNGELLSTTDINNIINAYTRKWTDNQIGYYVSYLYDI